MYTFSINNTAQIQIIVILGKGYPVFPPRVYLKSPVTQPNINDCRDLLSELIPKWIVTMRLNDIVSKIPSFLEKLSKIEKEIDLQRIGRFHIGKTFNLKFLNELGGE